MLFLSWGAPKKDLRQFKKCDFRILYKFCRKQENLTQSLLVTLAWTLAVDTWRSFEPADSSPLQGMVRHLVALQMALH